MRAEPVISEIMASNTKTLVDQTRAFSDWIELHNPEAAAVDLAGWYLADSAQTVEVTSGRVGAFALAGGSEDAALFVTLPPGAYTAEVRGKDGGEGVALLEIYVVP